MSLLTFHSLPPLTFTLRNSMVAPTQTLQLCTSTSQPTATTYLTIVQVSLVGTDLDYLKVTAGFAKAIANTFITANVGGIKDVVGRSLR